MVAENLKGLFLLNPEVAFLNHGSYGACPRPVFEAYQAWQRRLEAQPVAFLDPSRGLSGWMREARVALAAGIGAVADDLVGVMNATYGLNLVARSLPLGPGDEILTTDHEYAALEKTWDFVARKTGAVIRVIEVPLPLMSEAAFTQAVLAAIGPRTRVLFLSHVTSATALIFPIARVVAEARSRGIWTVIDGAHAPGLIPLDLDALDADFYAGNCHKWLLAPKGAAFLHVRRALQPMIEPLVISHGWTADGAEPGIYGNSAFIDRLEMQGTRDPAAWLSVPAALEFRGAQGWDRIARRCQELMQETAAAVAEMTGLAPLAAAEFTPPQMISMPVPDCDVRVLHDRLWVEHGIEIPVYRWKNRCFARLSVQGYNDEDDMERLLAALSGILTRG